MSELLKIFKTVNKKADKWSRYFPVYDRYMSKFKDKNITLLEVGVADGGSIDMWSKYFTKDSKIFGIDIDKQRSGNLTFDQGNVEIFIGDQGNPEFWDQVLPKIGPIDIFIDDGGHYMHQQIITLQKVFPHITEGGFAIVEDTHTSYMKEPYGMSYGNPKAFTEYSKQFVDLLNEQWIINETNHTDSGLLSFDTTTNKMTTIQAKDNNKIHELQNLNLFIKGLSSIHFYDSMIIFEKDPLVDMKMEYSYK